MAAFRDRFSRTAILNAAQEDAFNPIRGGADPAAALVRTSAAIATPGPHALIDTVPGDTTTTATLTVGAAPLVSAIDTIADEDFYQITLVAGREYQIGMYGYAPQGPGDPVGPNGLPLIDSFIELYDGAGNLLTSADGNADTVFNTANSGFDAVLTYTATASGIYYVNARAFDNLPLDGDNGDLIGDYGLYAKDVTDDPNIFTPYYDANSPLYAIDWGTQVNKVHQSYRNPDGNEGLRDTGNDPAPVDPGALLGHPGKNIISIYFAQEGDVFVSNDPTNPGLPPATITATGVAQFEHDAVMTALAEFAKVADVVYIEVTDRAEADFVYTSYLGTPGPGVSLLGSMSPPDESDEGLAQFNSGDYRWNEVDLQQGGFSFVTLIHEFGHGHGLAHPHDNGGHSGIMHGVEGEGAGVADYTTGDFELNQSVFTMMSYEDGWQSSPYGNAPTNVGYGYLGGLMAFDIAAIQDKYGVNEDTAAGNDNYVLKDVNAAGTYFSSIWDVDGNDSIVYVGSRDANIDLRAATLQYEAGGGGRVSYATGIFGGFTIANSVVIENALGGSGNDVLTGNAAANFLDGGAGADRAAGGAGNDTIVVDAAGDVVVELAGEGRDVVYARADYTLTAGAHVEVLSALAQAGTGALQLIGNEIAQEIYGNAGANFIDGGGGADYMAGLGGNDSYVVDNGSDVVSEAAAGGTRDVIYARADFVLSAGSQVEVLTALSQDGFSLIHLTGNELANELYGTIGVNFLDGGGGADALIGFAGNDTYVVDHLGDVVVEANGAGRDVVYARADYVLGAGMEIEVLSALSTAGTGALNLAGNGASNEIYGNAGVNTIDGGGGADYLMGFAGNDVFAFTTALGGGNVDAILDFAAGADKIALDDAVFGGIGGLGALAAGAFATGAGAADADDRIIYNAATGAVLFDADGNGAGAAVQFATLSTGLSLSAGDFTVI
jgi:serralysin